MFRLIVAFNEIVCISIREIAKSIIQLLTSFNTYAHIFDVNIAKKPSYLLIK